MHHTIQHITFYVLSLFLIAIGLSVVIRKKPLILNYRWYLMFMVLVLIPPALTMLTGTHQPSSFFPIILYAVLLSYMYFILRGFMVVGANGDDFQRAFIETLREGNYSFEQTFSTIKIQEPPLEFSVAFQSWTGSGQLRLKSKENKETFYKIVDEVSKKEIKTNLIIPSFYIIMGCLLLCMDLIKWR